MISRLLLAAAVLLVQSPLRAEPSAVEKHGFAPRLIIYNARGPDFCGSGCDRWIAVEGEVDAGAAARVGRSAPYGAGGYRTMRRDANHAAINITFFQRQVSGARSMSQGGHSPSNGTRARSAI
jgi:hypothetical protein